VLGMSNRELVRHQRVDGPSEVGQEKRCKKGREGVEGVEKGADFAKSDKGGRGRGRATRKEKSQQ